MGSNSRARDLSQDNPDLIGLTQLIRTFRNELSLETIDFQWHNSVRFCRFFFSSLNVWLSLALLSTSYIRNVRLMFVLMQSRIGKDRCSGILMDKTRRVIKVT